MAYTVKRKPERAHRPNPMLEKLRSSDKLPVASEAVREGAEEVRDKIRSDIQRLSQMAKMRRAISIRPMVVCAECAGAGKMDCLACGGAGTQKLILNDEVTECTSCAGTGHVACAECGGRGIVRNTNRKRILWLFGIGAIGWLITLWQLLGIDVAPEFRARHLAGGGGGGQSARAGAAPAEQHRLGEHTVNPAALRNNSAGPDHRTGTRPSGSSTVPGR